MTSPEPARPAGAEGAAEHPGTPARPTRSTTSAVAATTSHGSRRVAGLLALTGVTVGLVAAPMTPAFAAAEAGQSINNDYGQTDAEVAVEMAAAINGNIHVKTAAAAAVAARRVLEIRWAAEAKAKAAYLAAVRSKVKTRIAKTRKTYLYAHSLTVKAVAANTAAVTALARTRATVTAQVKAAHYRPKDGTFAGPVQNYLVPTLPKFSFEPLQVRISVYAGHVSNVEVIQQAPLTSESNSYNVMSLSTLCLEAMAAHDTANVAAVSGASLSSEAFQQSLTAALVAAGYKA